MAEREYRRTPDWPEIQTPLTGDELAEIWQDGEQRQGPLSVLGGVPSTHSASHKFGGTDVVGTQDKTANAIPITDGSGTLDVFVSDASVTVKGKVQLATDGESAASKAVQSNDLRMSNSRTPTAHAASHLGGSDNIMGETSSTVYRGDRGKTAYDHSLATGNPHGTAISDISTLTGKITPLSDLNRVFHLTGNGIPTFPDNVAGRAYWQDAWATTDGWTASGCILSMSGGKLTISTTSTDAYISKTGFSFIGSVNRLIRIKTDNQQQAASQGDLYYETSGHGFSASYHKFFTITSGKGFVDIDMGTLTEGGTDWITSTITAVRLDWGAQTSETYAIDSIYIGSGLFDTPVYGADGKSVWTNHGVLAVPGDRGNAMEFLGNGYFESPDPLDQSGVLAFKYTRKLLGINEHIISSEDFVSHTGKGIYINNGNQLVFIYGNGTADIPYPILNGVVINGQHDYVIHYTPTTVGPVYKDGVEVLAETALSGTILPYYGITRIGCPTFGLGDMINGILPDVRYESGSWDIDDALRYHNGDDAVDSQQKAQSPVPYSIMTRKSDGRTEVANGVDPIDAINKGQLDAACSEFLYQSYTAGSTFTAGQLGYLHTDGKVYLYDANSEASAKGALYIAIGAITANDVGTFQRGGEYTTTGLSAGAIYYGSETPGAITTTAPTTSGAIVRKIGFAQSSTVLFFNPSNDYVVLV